MKTLTILFESHNVFCAVIDGVNIRIDNPEILESKAYIKKINNIFFDCWNRRYLNSGDTFQVEGFEYELNKCDCLVSPFDKDCKYPDCKVAILKLAKEEEPKHHKPLREHFEVDTDAGICLETFRYIDALEKYIDEIEKLKK